MARLGSVFQYFLHGFKRRSGNNGRKTALMRFTPVFDKSEVGNVSEHSLYSGTRRRFSASAHHAPKIEARAQTLKGVFASRKLLERLLYNFCFHGVWLNGVRLAVVHVTKRCSAAPLTAPQFLANPALYILGQIIRVIFGLAKGYLEHKESLRSWLKPECGKAQRSHLADVYEIDDLSAINTVARKAIWMPTENAYGFLALMDFLDHLVKNFSPGLLCAFAFNKCFFNFQLLAFSKLSQLRKLGLNAHDLAFLVLGALASVEKVFGFHIRELVIKSPLAICASGAVVKCGI